MHVDDAYLTDQHDIDDQYSSILDGVDSSSFDGQYLIISHKKASVTMDKEIIYFNLIDRDGTIYMINQSIDDE